MRHKAFSLIELLVVCAIIIMMTILIIPTFSKYGGKSEFNLRTIEIKSLIEQMNNMAKNPEQGVTRYYIKISTSPANKVGLYKNNDDTVIGNLIKEIILPSGYSLAAANYLVCDTPASYCCSLATDDGSYCTSPGFNNTDFTTITNSNGTGAFKIFSSPFRVEYQ